MQDRLISGTEKPEDHFDRAIRPEKPRLPILLRVKWVAISNPLQGLF